MQEDVDRWSCSGSSATTQPDLVQYLNTVRHSLASSPVASASQQRSGTEEGALHSSAVFPFFMEIARVIG